MHFRWKNVFDDMRRMGRWSFWSWFEVNRSTFDEDMSEKRFFFIFVSFSFSFPVTLTCAISPLNYKFLSFPISKKIERTGRTDGQTDGRTGRNT